MKEKISYFLPLSQLSYKKLYTILSHSWINLYKSLHFTFKKMSTIDLLMNRHTIRNYDASYEIPKDAVEKIMEAVRLSPTAFTVQDVDFIVCTDRKKNQEATDAQLKIFDEKTQGVFESRKKNFKVSNVITCDASAEVIIFKNERASEPNCYIHAGIAAMAICVAVKDYGLDTMCHTAMVGPGAASVYGIDPEKMIMAVAIGKARPDAHISARQYNNKINYL
ncbi:nitroreductase family protein [Tritrichomonas foetus]|uniref:Nitroreductase family protein n=1 Tax=Tritrichomonas foetus TaxID=1144522 RepID=A0A1J4KAN2_9EUKA|nr:nitroreductase family protein [Tritrichomonas foetus]|eukprot:OHT06726.1 nitroreductase family protein [Tritrichomonas foetus]